MFKVRRHRRGAARGNLLPQTTGGTVPDARWFPHYKHLHHEVNVNTTISFPMAVNITISFRIAGFIHTLRAHPAVPETPPRHLGAERSRGRPRLKSRETRARCRRAPPLPLPLRPPPRGEEPWSARSRAIRRHPPPSRPIPAGTGVPDTGIAARCPAPAVFPGMARGRAGADAGKGQA